MLKIIKASAGSGKTYTLALEYITLLLGEKDKETGAYRLAETEGREYHRHILAVTFTNKATEEMKERIIKELAVLAGYWEDGKSPYLGTLCSRFGVEEGKVRQAAGRALGELLFDYTNFNVSTIDSFFQIILRTFAGEIDVPYDYNIELNEKYAMEVGIRDFLSRLRRNYSKADNPVVGWLNKYVSEKINEGSGWNIFSSIASPQLGSGDLFKFASVINTEQYRKAGREMAEYFAPEGGGNVARFQQAVGGMVTRCCNGIADAARRALQIIDNRGVRDFMMGTGAAAMIVRMAGGADCVKDEKPDNVLKYMAQPEKVLKKMAKAPALREAVIGSIAPELELIGRLYAEYLLLGNTNRNIYMLGLLGGISGSVGQFRKDNNLILLSDTNELLNDIISEEDTPFIYERIGVWINNFLVDEFQDTSALQWQNFSPLLSNSLSSGNDNLIIGDEKQCIYRFRNSDPSLLQYKVKQQFGSRAEVDGTKSTNWRSAPFVVKFNNTFFTMAAIRMGVTDVYGNVVQMPNEKKRVDSGYVRVEILDPPEKGSGGEDEAGGDDAGSSKFIDRVLERLPVELSAILDRGYRQSDVAILVNTNTEGAAVIKRLLEYNLEPGAVRNFKVISSDSLLLKNSPTVRLIISHLRYLGVAVELRGGQKTDRQELEEKIHRLLRQYEKYLNQGMQPEQAMELAVTSPVSREEMLGEVDEFVPRDSQCHNLVSVVERIIEKAVSPEARERENPFISALQDYVIEFSMRGVPGIRGFIDWWDRNCDKLSITSPAGVDAINVMTIHKSKGLEFPCVVIPFANWEMCKHDDTLWFSRDEFLQAGLFAADAAAAVPPLVPVKYYKQIDASLLAEAYGKRVTECVIDSLNKTYVAFTRAVDELHIFTERPDKPSESLANLSINEFLCEYGSDSMLEARVKELNSSHDSEVAVGVEKTDTGYCVGRLARNDGKPAELPKMMPMLPYFVINRHDLARFDLPEVFYTAKQERGILLHKILGMIHNEGEVERWLKYCRVRCVVLPEQYDEVCGIIRSILVQSDEVRRWFARCNKVYKERTFSVGGRHYRPDRVVVTPDGETVVIDFKFGDRHLPHYHQQVKQYMELVSAAGMPRVSGRIWYPLEGVIEKVE